MNWKKKRNDIQDQLKIISKDIEDIKLVYEKINKKLIILTNSYYHITKDMATLTEILHQATLEKQDVFEEEKKDKKIVYH